MMPSDPDPYEDDATISDDAQLWRRIPPNHILPDKNRGGLRISSAAFDNHHNGTPMSVVLGDDVVASGRDPSSIIAGHVGFCLASVTAGLARSLNQGIARHPLPEEPAHGEVFGKKTRAVRKQFSREAVWIVGPKAGTT